MFEYVFWFVFSESFIVECGMVLGHYGVIFNDLRNLMMTLGRKAEMLKTL